MRLLTRHEDIRLKPYRCTSGKLSIGVGRNLDDVGISVSEAQLMALNDITRVNADLDRELPWWRELSETRRLVLQDMCFNMGIGNRKRGLLSFVNTLEHIRRGRFDEAAQGMLASKWAVQVGRGPGQRAHRLAEMMRTDKFPTDV